ncbi:O-antigen ligase family protein [Secundilactobacillus silagei]|uniref:O-antigen ligase-related domain-containing protein n=1 Tax=Secundilactobacillus silagei JCM 19001 TaxID=1302250 RepID=A0A1Z5IKU2_9LACO|nr:O-antigen ligase family protein [Secundilactobacillus silagei]TDG71502.1 hypothetical protein C5L25_000892 [Secundilactobacillus silagei JCM 19001]GAX02394.1 hypothetical protein IWT126_02463 [Secundilactobacillus silagei JCM 19001]
MKKRKKATVSIYALLEYIFAFLTVLQVNSVIYIESNHTSKIKILWLGIGFLLMILSLYKLYKNRTNILPLIKMIFAFSLYSLVLLLQNSMNYSHISNILFFALIPIGLLIFFYEKMVDQQLSELLIIIKNIMVALAAISIFFWLIALIGIPTNMTATVTWGANSNLPGYFGMHYLAQGSVNFLGMNIVRNTGIFVEAPMYAYTLCIALLTLLFIEERPMKWQIFLISMTLISTTSTTGTVVGLIAFGWYFIFVQKVKNPIVKLIFIITIIVLLVAGIRYLLEAKVTEAWNSSSSLRANDYYAGFMAWKQHILRGNGLGNLDSIKNYMDYRRIMYSPQITGLTGVSNGIMAILAMGGILATLIYIIPTFLASLVSRKMAGFAILSFILFCTTAIYFSYLYILILSFFVICFYNAKYNVSESLHSQ